MALRSIIAAGACTKPFVPSFARAISSSPRRLESSSQPVESNPPQNTHFKITLHRSAISLGDRIKGTLESLGIHRRFQTVYHRHSPETAGKILAVKELVQVENVPEHLVRTKQQQTSDRAAIRGYKVVGSRREIVWLSGMALVHWGTCPRLKQMLRPLTLSSFYVHLFWYPTRTITACFDCFARLWPFRMALTALTVSPGFCGLQSATYWDYPCFDLLAGYLSRHFRTGTHSPFISVFCSHQDVSCECIQKVALLRET